MPTKEKLKHSKQRPVPKKEENAIF